MHRLGYALAGLIVVLSARPLAAQAGAAAVPTWFDASRLELGSDSLAIYLVRDDGHQLLGTLWDDLVREVRNGTSALRRTYRTTNRLFGDHHEVSHATYPSLRPLADRTDAAIVQSHTIYRADSIVGWSQLRDSARVEFALPAPPAVYDAQAVDLMIRSAELGPDFRQSFDAFLPSQQKFGRMTAWVTGTDSIPGIAGMPREVWVVEVDFDGLGSTMWIDKRTRALHRQAIRLAPGVEMVMERHRGA